MILLELKFAERGPAAHAKLTVKSNQIPCNRQPQWDVPEWSGAVVVRAVNFSGGGRIRKVLK